MPLMDDVRPSMVLRDTSSTNVVSRNENMQQGGVNTSSEPMKVEKIYLGGGGCGASNLVTTVLKGEQDAMFQRSILPSDRQHEANLQELRQISMVEKSIKLTVTVVREDIPSIQGIISLTYKKSSSQEAWGLFIRDVRAALDLDYIDCIMDIIDKSPVYMVDRLIPFATYLARQTEDSALMDALNDGGVPLTPSWQSVADIALVKQDLLLSRHFQERIDKKTTQILNMPMTRIEEYSISKKIIAAKTAVQILSHIKDIVKVSNDHYESKRISDMNRENTVSYDDHGLVISTVEVGDHDDTVPFIDLASLHRLAFESLGRRAVRYPKEIANDSLQFVLTSIQTYGDKVDVIVLGLKLLNDVMAFVPLGGNMGVCQVFHVVMNCAQFYAPDLPEYYGVRKTPYRLIKSEDISATNSGKSKGSTPASTSTSEKVKSAKSSQKALDSIEVAISQQSEKISTPPIEEPAPPLTTLPPIPVTGWKGSKGTKNAGIRRVQLPVKVDLEPKILTSEERFSLLPVVPGIIFQAFSSHLDNKNKSKKRLSLMQIFATLYKYTSFCYENRKLLFELKVHDELCEIAFMCDGWPRALSYVGWILDSMYGDILACGTVHDLFVDEWEQKDKIRVVHLSSQFLASLDKTLCCFDYLTIVNTAPTDVLEAAETTEGAVAKKINDGSKERHNRREVAYSLDILMCDRKRKTVIVNRKLFNLLGHRDFTARYLRSPSDDVVVAMALVAGHKDMEKAERDTATVWLDLWDDSSLHFQYLRKRGLERSGSS